MADTEDKKQKMPFSAKVLLKGASLHEIKRAIIKESPKQDPEKKKPEEDKKS